MIEYRLHGPPGTGKTWTLATKWLPAAIKRFGAHRVAICSLTRAAASVIAGRNTGIPNQNIGTLHALAYRAVGRPGIGEGNLEEWNEIEPALRLTDEGAVNPDQPFLDRAQSQRGDDLMAQAQVYRHRRIPMERWSAQVRHFQKRWDAWLAEHEWMDFTGLIEAALEYSTHAPGKPAVLIVDEAQDCSELELALIRKWGESADHVVLAGDGDQAIYQWRGASPKAFLGGDIPAENNYHLTQSYRVPRAVHKVAASWVAKCSERYAVEYLPTNDDGSFQNAPTVTSRLPIDLIARIERSLTEGRSTMVLASCGYMLKPTIKFLKTAGIPFHNPYRRSNGAWNPLRGGGDKLRAFLGYVPDERRWTWAQAHAWIQYLKMAGLPLPRGMKARINSRLMAAKESGRSIENDEMSLDECHAIFGTEGLGAIDRQFREGTAVEWYAQHMLPAKRRKVEYALEVYRKRGAEALSVEPKVIVGTIHSVKGGEADDVYLYPDLSQSGMREWLQPGESRDGVIRMIYVGMTRAKSALYLCGRSGPKAVDW